MLVRICNFEYFSDREVEILEGVSLITGDNGAGKTTLLRAVFFGLYGKIVKEDRKLSKETREESWVEISTDQIWIRRQRNPGRLQVEISGESLEDAAAQAEIDRIFQGRDLFRSIFYIPQDRLCALLTATPGEQEQILTNLAFQGQDPDLVLLKISDQLRSCKAELKQGEAAYNSQLETFERMSANVKTLKTTPEKVKDVHEDILAMEADLPDWKRKAALHQRNLGQKKALEKESSSLGTASEVSEAQVNHAEALWTQAEDQLKDYTERQSLLKQLEKFPEVEPVEPSRLKQLSQQISEVQAWKSSQRTRARLLKRLDDLPPVEVVHRSPTEIQQIRTQTQKYQEGIQICIDFGLEYDSLEIQECLDQAESKLKSAQKYQDWLAAYQAVEKLPHPESSLEEEQQSLEQTQKELKDQLDKLKSAQGRYECPQCGVHLALIQQQLVQSAPQVNPAQIHAVEQELKSIPRKLQEISKQQQQWLVWQTRKEALPEKPEPVELNPNTRKLFQNALKQLPKVEVVTNPGIDLEQEQRDRTRAEQRQSILQQLEELPVESPEGDLDQLLDLQSQLQAQQAKAEQSAKHRPGILKQLETLPEILEKPQGLDKLQQTYRELKHQRSEFLRISRRREQIDTELQSLKFYPEASEEVQLLEEDLDECRQWLRRAETSLKIFSEQELLDQQADRLDALEARVSVLEQLKEQAVNLKASMIEAAIESLSIRTNEILERLFRESITLSLTMFKQLKSRDAQKRNFHLEISYRGRDYDSFWELSGGERARLSVAMSLALTSQFQVPLLMMDETLSALDGDIKSQCIEVIRDICPGQMVMIVAQQHHVNEADFDHVVKL